MRSCFILLTIISILQVFAASAFAKIDIESTQPLYVPLEETGNEPITQKDVENIIPTDLKATGDMGAVAARIVDRSVQSWFNSASVQGSVLGQTATTVQRKLAADVTLASSDENQAVQHKFSFSLMAFQAAAKLQYSGFLNAVFNYDARAARSVLEFSEKIFNKDFFLNHSSSSVENISSVGVKWGW